MVKLGTLTSITVAVVMLFFNFIGELTRYVSDVGSGTICSLETPCSFSTAQSLSRPGDTIHIIGTWTKALTISVSGTELSPIIIKGDAIQASTLSHTGVLISGNYLEIRDLDISGGWEFGVRVKGSYVKFVNVSVHDSVWENRSGSSCIGGSGGWGRGLTFAPTAHHGEVSGGKIYNNCGEGLTVTQSRYAYFHNVEVFNNFSRNVYIGNSAYVTVENINSYYSNPEFYRNGSPGRCIGLAIESTNFSTYGNLMYGSIIRGNLLRDCMGINFYAEVSNQYPSNILVENNTFINVPRPQVNIPGTNIVIRNNIINPVIHTNTPTLTSTATSTPTATLTSTSTPTPDLCLGGEKIFEDTQYTICAFPK